MRSITVRCGPRRRRRARGRRSSSGVVEVAELGRGHEVERGDDVRRGRRRLDHLGRDRARAAGARRTNSWPCFTRPFAIEIDDLARELVGVGLRGRRRRRPTSRGRRPARRTPTRCRTRSSGRDPVAPLVPAARRRRCAALSPVPRPEQHLVPDARQPRREPLPAGPSPPKLRYASRSFAHATPSAIPRSSPSTQRHAADESPRRATGGSPESGDAVGAEEDAELGEEAVAGVAEEVVAEAEHGVFSGPSRCTNTGLSPGCSRRGCSLSLPTLVVGERVELAPSPAPAGRCRATSSGRVISIAMSFGVSSRTSSRPLTTTIASSSSSCAVLQPSSSGTPSPRSRPRGPRARTWP